MLIEISQTKKDKYYISLICGVLNILQTNVYANENRLTQKEKKLVVTKWERERGQVKNKRKPLKEQRRGEEAVVAGKEKRCR